MHADQMLLMLLGVMAALTIPAGFILVPVWKRWARRLEHGEPVADTHRLQQDVDDLRARVSELEERLDFSERLLTRAKEIGQLPGEVR